MTQDIMGESADSPSLLHTFLQGGGIEEHEVEDRLSYRQHLIAGAVAGITEHCSMFPLDTIKTRIQVIGSSHHSALGGAKASSALETCRAILKFEGWRKFFRGMSAMALGAGPSHAVYFATYEQVRKLAGGEKAGVYTNAISGALATVVGDAVLTPMDTIKQRMQLYNSPYRNLVHVFKRMLREEGVGAFYASYKTTLIMNVPFCAVQFASYHVLKDTLHTEQLAPSSTESVVAHWICGGLAGACAAGLTTPMDVIRTALQTQGALGHKYRGASHVAREIWSKEGVRGFSRGWGPRVLFHFPGAAICWTTYEYCKDQFELS